MSTIRKCKPGDIVVVHMRDSGVERVMRVLAVNPVSHRPSVLRCINRAAGGRRVLGTVTFLKDAYEILWKADDAHAAAFIGAENALLARRPKPGRPRGSGRGGKAASWA